MLKSIIMLLAYSSFVSTLIPIIVGLKFWQKLQINFKVFVLCYFVYFVVFGASFILGKLKIDNSWLSPLSDINSTVTYCSFMFFSTNSIKVRKIILFATIPILVIGSMDFFFKILKYDLKLFANPIGNLYNITVIIVFISRIIFKNNKGSVRRNPVFILLLTILFPALYSFFYEAFGEIIIANYLSLFLYFYAGSLFIYTLRNFLIAYCICEAKGFNKRFHF